MKVTLNMWGMLNSLIFTALPKYWYEPLVPCFVGKHADHCWNCNAKIFLQNGFTYHDALW